MRFRVPQFMVTAVAATLLILPACATAPSTQADRDSLHDQVRVTLDSFAREDPEVEQLIGDAYGFAVFPSVGKGGAGIGGSWGRGEVYEQGELIGYTTLTQGTIGPQLGGQTFRQLILFEDRDALEHLIDGRLSFAAGASAVALGEGAAAQARYRDGVVVFTQTTGGLMVEASVGGQQFEFYPLRDLPEAVAEPPEQVEQ